MSIAHAWSGRRSAHVAHAGPVAWSRAIPTDITR